ncbi:MAG: Gfo/Idh/MocA family oxidoreductase [Rhodobacteraceae bacterium]|nr:Gfo/Idh/MocA family oxidoreductase [Paracoccaceae bacterium]MCF8521036.1 Gfo/Idh/MocA family oxidoreductase [Paracoccaceae bacterium]
MSSISIAIVGAGYMAEEHARAFASLPGVRIAGIHSHGRARAEGLAAKYGASAHDSVDALWAETRADILIVAVPELAARGICEAAFAHPWLCILEKPAGYDLADALAIEAAATAAGARVHVAFNRRFYGSTQAVAEALLAEEPRLITVLDQQSMAEARGVNGPEAVVQTWMYANSIHLIDYFTHLGRGPITDVTVTAPWDQANPGTVMATLHFASGDLGMYQAVWNGPAPWIVTVGTPEARYEMRPLEKLSIQPKGQRRAVEQPGSAADSDFKPGLLLQAQHTLAALRGEAHSLPTLAASTRSMRLVAAIYGFAPLTGPL